MGRDAAMARPIPIMLLLLLAFGPQGASHDPASYEDTHRYIGGGWAWPSSETESCKWDEDHGGALPFTGIGGECFETRGYVAPADVAPGTAFRIVVTDDHIANVGFRIRTEATSGPRLYVVGCGQYPADDGWAHLPPETYRIWIVFEAFHPLLMLQGCGPATTGNVTLMVTP